MKTLFQNLKTWRLPPEAGISIGALLTFLIMALMAWNVWHVYVISMDIEKQEVQFLKLHGAIIHLDEALTMSASLAAATGNMKWENRYEEMEPKLGNALAQMEHIAMALGFDFWTTETQEANDQLVQKEREVFRLSKQGRQEQAQDILTDKEYVQAKHLYSKGMQESMIHIQQWVQEQQDLLDDHITDTVFMVVLANLLLFGLWASLYVLIRRFSQNQHRLESRLNLQLEVAQVLATASSIEMAHQSVLKAVCTYLQWSVGALWAFRQGESTATSHLHCVTIYQDSLSQYRSFMAKTQEATFALGIGLPDLRSRHWTPWTSVANQGPSMDF